MRSRWILLACIAIILSATLPATAGWLRPATRPVLKTFRAANIFKSRTETPSFHERTNIPRSGILPRNSAEETAQHIIFETVPKVSGDDLVKLEPFSQDKIAAAIKELVASQIALKQAEKDLAWTFDAGTGKLTTKAAVDVAGGQIKFEETNVYKIIGLIAAPIAACVVVERFDERLQCVKKELKKHFPPPIRVEAGDKPAGNMQ